MRFPPANVQLRRAQLILMLVVLVPTILLVMVGIVALAVGSSSAFNVLIGILVLTFCTTAITGYILGTIFLGKGASLVRIQNDFLSSVGHELRTPLTSLRLLIDSLRDGRLTPEETQHVLRLLGGETERLDRLVGRLLELSRIESGAHAFERARVEIDDVVKDAIAAFDAATLTNPTKITTVIEPGLALVGDRATLGRAVLNLLVNAWKYSGADKQIRLEARGLGPKLELAVTDNGHGIERKDHRVIFDEFTRGKDAIDRRTEGTGLGLAFVRAIVRAHRGKVIVESTPGQGSTFRLRLPRGRLDALEASQARRVARGGSPT